MKPTMNRDHDTEHRIFEAARAVFFEQGFDGARMSEIARRAEINQSMLHYYFRSKGQLFDAVFRKAAGEVLPPVVAVLRSDLPIVERLDRFVASYIDVISANPHLPAFILQELRRNPDALRRVAGSATEGVFERFGEEVRAAARRGDIREIDPMHLITSVLALCVFPFIARPMLQAGLGLDDEGFECFIAVRRTEVSAFIRSALRP
jgi:AcrR family transcriptional regulator